jgi:hypothetical protein
MRQATWSARMLVLLLALPSPVPATDVTKALEHMAAALEPGRDMRATVEFLIDNGRGERVRWAGRYYRTTTPAVKRIVLDAPDDLAGVSVVLEGGPAELRGVRIYLPFVRRIREIRRDMRGASFMGSDFTFEDLGFVEMEFHQHTVVGDATYDGRPCLRVDSVPDRSWWYGRIAYCIETEDWLPRRTEYFDRAGVLYKVRTMAVETVGGHPTPMRMTMDVLPDKTKTTMILTDVRYDSGLTPAMLRAEAGDERDE